MIDYTITGFSSRRFFSNKLQHLFMNSYVDILCSPFLSFLPSYAIDSM